MWFLPWPSTGVTSFLTLVSMRAVPNISIKDYASTLEPNGLQLVEVPSTELALEWLKHQP